MPRRDNVEIKQCQDKNRVSSLPQNCNKSTKICVSESKLAFSTKKEI